MTNNSKFFMSDGISCYQVMIVGRCSLGCIAVIKGNKKSRFPELERIWIKKEFFTKENEKSIRDGSGIQLDLILPHIEQHVALQEMTRRVTA